MALENEINQTSFRSEDQKAIVNIIFTYHWVTEQVKSILADEDITMQQYNILRILRGSHPDPLSTLTIRERMLDKMSDTSRIVDRMLRKGLVVKRICSNDKRLVDVNLTEEGLIMLLRLDERMDAMDKISSGLNQEELKNLNHLLDKLRIQPGTRDEGQRTRKYNEE
jgi:MarR family 2-MHQ and catechol resistance regulon transcriptional repressor